MKNCRNIPEEAFFTYPGLTAFTNCLWERVSLSGLSQQIYLYNNLFRGGTLNYGILNGGNNALAYDNLFDRTSIINSGPPTYTNVFVSGYNGYVTNYPTLTNSSGHDRVLTNSPLYQTGSSRSRVGEFGERRAVSGPLTGGNEGLSSP